MNFDNNGCNGWVVVSPDVIVSDSANNYHVVEVEIKREDGKIVETFRNAKNETMCHGRFVKNGSHPNIVRAEDAATMRLELAKLQNEGKEICGQCVARFYADSNNSMENTNRPSS